MHLCLFIAIALLLLEAPQSFGQTPQQKSAPTSPQTAHPAPTPPAPAQIESEPQATTASFGDWLLRCQRVGKGSEAHRNCEMVLSVIAKGQQAPVAQLAFGKPTATDPLQVTAAIPHNITFPSTVRVAIDEKDPQAFDLPWTRCLPAACFATAVPRDDLVKRWRAQTGAGRLTFKDAAGRDVVLPISFNGLASGLDALAKEH